MLVKKKISVEIYYEKLQALIPENLYRQKLTPDVASWIAYYIECLDLATRRSTERCAELRKIVIDKGGITHTILDDLLTLTLLWKTESSYKIMDIRRRCRL